LTAGRSVSADTSSDTAGRYQFTQLDPGSYTLTFIKGGFVSVQFGQKLPSDPPKRIDLKDGQKLEGIDIALTRGGAIEGRVTDESGEPVVEAIVSAMRVEVTSGERRLVSAGRSQLTNDRGDYRVYGLSPGDYCVSVAPSRLPPISFTVDPNQIGPQKASGYASIFYPSTADVSEAGVVTVRPGQTTSEINIVFKPVRLARVAGMLVSAGGKLVDGAHVVNLWRSSPLGLVGSSQVAKDGAFAIADVPPGQYILRTVPTSVLEEIARTGSNVPLTDSPNLEFGSQ
jgi:hypothetical protein